MKNTLSTRVPSLTHVRSLENRIAHLEKALAAMQKQVAANRQDIADIYGHLDEIESLPYARPSLR